MALHAEQTVGNALVLGMGSTGVSMAAWLARHNVPAMFADSRTEPPGADRVRALLPDAIVQTGALPERVPAGVDTWIEAWRAARSKAR